MTVRTQQGTFSWNELLTTDVGAAKSFYTQLFGWNAEDMPTADGQAYTIFKVKDEQVAGLMTIPPQAQQAGAPPYWGAYITVDNADQTAKKAQEMGATILVPPMDIPGMGRFGTIQDPQGAVISFIQYEQR